MHCSSRQLLVVWISRWTMAVASFTFRSSYGNSRPVSNINVTAATMNNQEFKDYLLKVSREWLLNVVYFLCDNAGSVDTSKTLYLSTVLPDIMDSTSEEEEEESESHSESESESESDSESEVESNLESEVGTDSFVEGQSFEGVHAQDEVKNVKQVLQRPGGRGVQRSVRPWLLG